MDDHDQLKFFFFFILFFVCRRFQSRERRRISNSLVPHTPTLSQGRRRNRYRPSCLIRDFLKAASTDTAQITLLKTSFVFFSFATHSSLLFLV